MQFVLLGGFLTVALGGVPPDDTAYLWNDTAYPKAVPATAIPDGPIAANGNVGVSVGAPEDKSSFGVGLWLGKNDLWGVPGPLLWHGSFTHLSPSRLSLSLSIPGEPPLKLGRFTASQRLRDGSINVTVSAVLPDGTPIYLDVANLTVQAEAPLKNVLTAITRIRYSQGRTRQGGSSEKKPEVGFEGLTMTVTLSADNPFGLPVKAWAEPGQPVLQLQKDTIQDRLDIGEDIGVGLHKSLLLPCSEKQISFNSIRQFALSKDGFVTVFNQSAPSEMLCLLAKDGVVFTVPCLNGTAANLQTEWQLRSDSRIVQTTAPHLCLSAVDTNSTVCPPGSFPPVLPPCRSQQFAVTTAGCDDATQWAYDDATRQLRSTEQELCLASVYPTYANRVMTAVSINVSSSHSKTSGGGSNESASISFEGPRNNTWSVLAVAVISERDLAVEPPLSRMSLEETAKSRLEENMVQGPRVDRWWDEFWSASDVNIGADYPVLQRFYHTMSYLLRSSMGAQLEVAPGLWGPFSSTDSPGWGDQFTLDYNFQANFWSTCTANRPHFIPQLYTETIVSQMKFGEQRAALADWSEGGWPDVHGGELAGMACGPTPSGKWDHMYGCEKGFGGFKGMEFSSACGPFAGQSIFMDDGTRFVAGLAATPMIEYFESTLDQQYWNSRLEPFLSSIAEFYLNYAVFNYTGAGNLDLPFTCAQEICSGTIGNLSEHNALQDLAYARQVVNTLMMHVAQNDTRQAPWHHFIATLAPFPIVKDAHGNDVFAEAWVFGDKQPSPLSNSAYSITHFAPMHPSMQISLDSPHLLAVARATSNAINNVSGYAPGNGLCLSWPTAARVLAENDAAQQRQLLAVFEDVLLRTSKPNGWPDTGGGGLEQIGALDAIHAMLLQSTMLDRETVRLRLFPAWPANSTASFKTLRSRGAVLVTAALDGSAGAFDGPVILTVETERLNTIKMTGPWWTGNVGGHVCVEAPGSRRTYNLSPQHGSPDMLTLDSFGATTLTLSAGSCSSTATA